MLLIQKAAKPRRINNAKRIEALTTRMSGAVKIGLVNGIEKFKARIKPQEIYNAWASGDYNAVTEAIPWNKMPEDMDDLYQGVSDAALRATGLSIEALPPEQRPALRFDAKNPKLARYVQTRTGSLIQRVSHETRETVRQAVMRSFNVAATPRQISRRIVGAIGLLPAQQDTLVRYRMGLTQSGMSPSRVDALEDSYRNRMLAYRAQTIARTETASALNVGQLEVWKGAAQEGLISHESKKVWQVDGHPCEECDDMDGEAVGLNEFWVYTDGRQLEIPTESHPNCMCSMSIEMS